MCFSSCSSSAILLLFFKRLSVLTDDLILEALQETSRTTYSTRVTCGDTAVPRTRSGNSAGGHLGVQEFWQVSSDLIKQEEKLPFKILVVIT